METSKIWLPIAIGSALTGRYLWSRTQRYAVAGRTAAISGGTRGLGYLLARELARRGAHVFVFSRDTDEVSRAVDKLRAHGLEVDGLRCDVRDPNDVANAVTAIVRHTGRLDVVVNNAGVIQVTPFENAHLEDFEESLRTHFWGPLHLIRASLPYLRRDRGRILNVSSIGGRIGVPHLSSYCAGKFALVGLSESLRAELAKDGISVTTATPGLMRTGSHLHVELRGQHAREAQWFGASLVSPLTSMNANRAARMMVNACVTGRAHVTPGIQARLAEMLNAVAPEFVATLASLVTRGLLPGPADTPSGDQSRVAGEVGFGWLSPFVPKTASRRNNELPI
jgi:NAD(P)-dependent dehydrogenase (short-subunit alcohol dehydrogenase family)